MAGRYHKSLGFPSDELMRRLKIMVRIHGIGLVAQKIAVWDGTIHRALHGQELMRISKLRQIANSLGLPDGHREDGQ